MTLLLLAVLVWLALHLGVAGTKLRAALVAAVGERGFRGAFSVASVAALIFLGYAYARSGTVPLWTAPAWAIGLLDVVMLAAALLLVGSLTRANPTMAGTGQALAAEPRGVLRITRHPMLWAFALWAIVHILARGDLAGFGFFGAFLLTALFGMPSIDGKLARRDPPAWAALARATSIVPFAAILAGRNRLALAEIGWRIPLLGVLLWVVMLVLHAPVLGVSPLPL